MSGMVGQLVCCVIVCADTVCWLLLQDALSQRGLYAAADIPEGPLLPLHDAFWPALPGSSVQQHVLVWNAMQGV